MQPICRGAGAEVLELTLPEEEEEQQEQPELVPTCHGKQAKVKSEPEEEARVKEEEVCSLKHCLSVKPIWAS